MKKTGTWSWRLIFLVILLTFLTILFIRVRLISIVTPNVGGVEQNVVYACQQLAAGNPVYTDPAQVPYAIIQYTPLYFYLVTYTGHLLGVEATSCFPWFSISRGFSLFCNLLMILVVYFMLLRLTKGKRGLSVALSMLLFIFIEQQDYSRPDSLYHLFFMLGMHRFLLLHQGKTAVSKLSDSLLAGLFTALAIFSKQSGIFLLVLGIAFYLWRKPGRKHLLAYCTTLAISLFILTLLFIQVSPQILYKNLVLGIMNGFDPVWTIKQYLLPAVPRFSLFFLLATLVLLLQKNKHFQPTRPLIAAMLYYLVITLLSGMKWGSGTNYFFEFCTLTLLLIPTTLQYLKARAGEEFTRALLLSVALVFIVPQTLIVAWRDYYKPEVPQYKLEKAFARGLLNQSWLKPEDKLIVMHRRWLNNILHDRVLFPQADVFKTIYPSKNTLVGFNIQEPDTAGKIYIITPIPERTTSIFHINTAYYKPVWTHGPFLVLGPSGL